MADVGWVRLSTRLFENRKIKYLLNQPKGAELVLLWVHLLCAAGTVNDGGRVYISQNVMYTPQSLAADFGVPKTIADKALTLFQDLELIEVESDGCIQILGWEKHQNVTGLEKIREQNRLRKQKQRQCDKSRNVDEDMSRDSHVTECDKSRNVTQQRREEKNRKEKDDYHHPKRNDDDEKKTHTEIFALWEKNMMPLTPIVGEKLQALLGEVGEAAVEQGILAAVEHGARNFAYVQTVARNYVSGNSKKQGKEYTGMDLVNELYGGEEDAATAENSPNDC
ncbi:phage replisome organizer N-terminal domain-containing protein [Phascolarctobacterium succinatutens]|jgi:predicted phage replisome organizer|uniref:phage replisome organizer N-terminal domain-containing protein n=1 Tax=Phascolarctobacterium succinatutens TaxID=626940 RepID=UPI0026E9BD9E|nr:phage replisome organizer N-terminal domain-containing protein [Phascolarctobacterium succinatutens]